MISINKCRNLILYLLEKNNRGFIEPGRFDAFCDLAQRDLFENLFYTYNKWVLNKGKGLTGTEYADILKALSEQIDVFAEYSTTANFTYSSVEDLWRYTGNDLYRTEGLSLVNAQGKKKDVEEHLKGYELNNLVNSKINPPTVIFPIYTRIGTGYRTFPKVPTGYSLELLYIRTPKTPKWTYITDSDGNPLYNAGASDLQDIELHESMYALFITKVLGYCGLSIKETEVVEIAGNQELLIEQKQ